MIIVNYWQRQLITTIKIVNQIFMEVPNFKTLRECVVIIMLVRRNDL